MSFTDPSYLWDYYRFEWFRILAALVALLVSGVVILDIYLLMYVRRIRVNFVGVFVLKQCVITISLSIAYASFFIFLQHFHQPIGDRLEKYHRIGRMSQRRCLRTFAYLYVPFSVSIMTLVSLAV